MDLASGYSDSINYGNGYTPLATGAINNNNAAYAQQQAAMAAYAQAMQNNVFASGGGFGQQTADYAGAGAAYGRATGGFAGNSIPGGYPAGDVQRGPDLPNLSTTPDPFGGASAESQMLMLQDPAAYYRKYGGFGDTSSSSFNDRFSAAPAITPGLQPQGGDYSAFPNAISAGVDPSRNVNVGNSSFNSRFGAFPDPATPMYTPADFPGWQPQTPVAYQNAPIMNQGGGGAATPQSQALMLQDPAAYYRLYGGGDGGSFAPPPSRYDPGGSFAPPPGTSPQGPGGIGSDAVRDQMAWLLAQQSPYAGPGIPSNGPYPNLGYNPAMANSFANPTMQQYDWTANNATLQQQMQDALKTIDQSTGRQPEQPYGGQLPSFWQGVRDWTGMGPARPTGAYDTGSAGS